MSRWMAVISRESCVPNTERNPAARASGPIISLCERQKVIVDVAFFRKGDRCGFPVCAFHEPHTAAERNEGPEIVTGAIQIGLKAYTDIRELREHATVGPQRHIDVRVLLHVYPDEGVSLLCVCHERTQIGETRRFVDVEAELGQLD